MINYRDHDNRLMETASGILEVFRENSVEQLRLDLWDWMKYLNAEKFSEPRDFSDIYKSISTLIDGAWTTLKRAQEEGFKHYSCCEPLEVGPCLKTMHSEKEERARRFRKRITHYSGKILHLEQEEVYDFYAVFEGFFHYQTLTSWKALLHEGSICSQDKQPFGTRDMLYLYERLAKLIESCFLVTRILLEELKGFPHFGYMDKDWKAMHLNSEEYDSPYENVNYALTCYNATQFKKQLKRWYKCAISSTKIWNDDEPGRLVLLYQFIQKLVDNAWFIYGCDEIMTRWKKDPYRNELFYNKPKLEKEKGISKFSLSTAEIEDPHSVFSSFFSNHHLTYDKTILQDWLRAALFSDTAENENDEFFSALNRLIEAWYLINFKLCYPNKNPLTYTDNTDLEKDNVVTSDENSN